MTDPPIQTSPRSWCATALVLVLLTYPIMGSKLLPFGGGARYMSVLAGPLSLVMLLLFARHERAALLSSAWQWSKPFLPFVAGWTLIQLWHRVDAIDYWQLTRVFWGAVIYLGARWARLTRVHLAYAACAGALAYLVIGSVEVFIMDRPRAWGGVYENRFGQFSVWLSGLCLLHVVFAQQGDRLALWLRSSLLLGSVAGLFAALLSGSRGALLALPALLPIVFVMSKAQRRRLITPSVVAAALVAAAILLHAPTHERLELVWQQTIQYFTQPSFVVTAVGIRLEMARIALQVLSEHPWAGVGFQSFPMLVEKYPSFATIPPPILAFSGFHSDWGHVIAVGGGTLVLALLGSLLLLARRTLGDAFLMWCLLCAVIFSISELFFCNKLGFSYLVSTWALYAAARANSSASGER